MTTTIADNLLDGGLSADGKATVRFTPAAVRDASDASGIIGRKTVTATVNATTGAFTAELDPGVWDVRIKSGPAGEKPLETRINVPDTGTTLRLWPLIESYVEQPVAVVNAAVAAKEAAEAAAATAEGLSTAQDEAIAALAADTGSETRAALNATYAPAFADTAIAYTGGNVTSVTENGITTTYTYNPDGTVATDTRVVGGVTTTRTYTYDPTTGNLTGIEAA